QHLEIALDPLADARPQDLDDDALARPKLRAVHLRDRRGRERRRLERRERLGDRPAERALDDRNRLLGREWRDLILQLRELVADILRQQVAADRQRLAELHEDRAEL